MRVCLYGGISSPSNTAQIPQIQYSTVKLPKPFLMPLTLNCFRTSFFCCCFGLVYYYFSLKFGIMFAFSMTSVGHWLSRDWCVQVLLFGHFQLLNSSCYRNLCVSHWMHSFELFNLICSSTLNPSVHQFYLTTLSSVSCTRAYLKLWLRF